MYVHVLLSNCVGLLDPVKGDCFWISLLSIITHQAGKLALIIISLHSFERLL